MMTRDIDYAPTHRGGVELHKYEIVASGINQMIAESLSPHDALPSERELMATYGVSRMTVRAAIARLVDQGRIYNIQGSGTFVGSMDVSKTPRLTSFTEDMLSRGFSPGSRILGATLVEADDAVSRHLQIPAGSYCTHLRRLRLADEHPMALEDVFVPRSILDLQNLDLTRSLYAQLATAGFEVYRAEQEIRSVAPSDEDCRFLSIPSGSPALCVERVSSSARGQLIEFARTLYRFDRYSFRFAVARDSR